MTAVRAIDLLSTRLLSLRGVLERLGYPRWTLTTVSFLIPFSIALSQGGGFFGSAAVAVLFTVPVLLLVSFVYLSIWFCAGLLLTLPVGAVNFAREFRRLNALRVKAQRPR